MNWFVIIVLIILVSWVVLTYNNFIHLRNFVRNSFSGIDVQLKRRADLIPQLITIVKGYAKHEKEVFEEIAALRTQMVKGIDEHDVSKLSSTEKKLRRNLKSIFAVAENYPKLQASKNFMKLQEELAETEDQVAAARNIYNNNTESYNSKIETFPNSVVAKLFGFKQEVFFRK